MTDLERLLINLDGIAEHLEDERAPTLAECVREAIGMLTPVKPVWRRGISSCGHCGLPVQYGSNYCRNCGRAVKWSG